MALTLVAVTGPVLAPDGSQPANGRVTFTLTSYDIEGAQMVAPVSVAATLDSEGDFALSLWGVDTGGRGLLYDMQVTWWSAAEGRMRGFGSLVQVRSDAPGAVSGMIVGNATEITPIALADAIAARNLAQSWAESDTAPGATGTKSAKTWAGEGAASAAAAALSEAAAEEAADISVAALSAAEELLGAPIYKTRSAANAALSGLSNGTFAQVLVDETLSGQRTLYTVTAGAFVFVRTLGDQTRTTIAARDGATGYLRNTMNTLSKWSDDIVGNAGASNVDLLPIGLTASQSGTTVTATTSVLSNLYVGMRILWDSGEEAVITAVITAVDSPATTTATVDRAQTVTSGPATIKAKHYIAVFYGDSLGQRLETVFCKLFWRKLGFGGIVLQAGSSNANSYSQSASVTLSAGASLVTDDLTYDDFPWSTHWSVPSGESVRFELLSTRALGVERPLNHGLAPQEMTFDTFIVAWLRQAGAAVVERKRRHDAAWVTAATVADTSVGSTKYSFVKLTHEARFDWQYRIRSTSGTVQVPLAVIRNDQAPGYLNWSIARGSRTLTDFAALSASDLGELGRIVGVPDTRFVFVFDAEAEETVATATADLEADRALWQSAMPRTDHVWVQGYEPVSNQAGQVEWNKATVNIALKYNDGLIALEDFFGDFETNIEGLGLTAGNGDTHVNSAGMVTAAWLWFRQFGLEDIPSLKEGRDISAQRGDFRTLRVLGRDVGAALTAIQTRPVARDRGLKWDNSLGEILVGLGAMGGAVGTGDVTISVGITVAPGDVGYAVISSDGGTASSLAGSLAILQVIDSIRLVLTNGSGATLTYRWNYFRIILAGQTGVLTLRTDVANARVDWLWNGEHIEGLVFDSTLGTGDLLGTWSGTGTDFSIRSATTANAQTCYSAMAWRSRLTDAQIRAVVAADAPAGTNPDFWWDFRGRSGRAVRDVSGNGKHARILRASDAQALNLTGTSLAWACPDASVLGNPWVGDLNAVTTLVPGDDVIAAFSANRDMLLPATAALGDVIRVTVNSTFTIRITQNVSQQIKCGESATTVGTGGSLTIPNNTSLTLRCIVGGTSTVWVVESHTGAALTFA